MVSVRYIAQTQTESTSCRCCGSVAREDSHYCGECIKVPKYRSSDSYYKRRASGVCVVCEVPLFDGEARCVPCNADIGAINKARTDERRNLGLCPNCGDQAASGHTKCDACMERSREYTSTDYYRHKLNHQCIQCGKLPALENRVRCVPCLEKDRLKHRLKRSRLKCAV